MDSQGLSVVLFVYVLTFLVFQSVESLDCMTCSNVHNTTQCGNRTCQLNEQCFTYINNSDSPTFSLGCKHSDQCNAQTLTQTQPPAIIGRDLPSNDCQMCCSTDMCNRDMTSCNLKSQVTLPPCKDDADYNCEMFGAQFDICSDKAHASTICRHYCHLCDYSDGNWSPWSAWSTCDVTCDTGHRTRDRTCTNPAPAHGGKDCVGQPRDTSTCTLEKCPVHGGWAGWTPWSGCSVTCGVGLMSRDRLCDSPVPGPHGHPCNGAAGDFQICSLNGCVDGQWSIWTSWSSCTATCNGGVKSRGRDCNNPAPSTNGRYCQGNNKDVMSCNIKSCSDHPIIYFDVQNPRSSLVGGRAVFTTTLYNVGSGYSTSTGKFTCSIAGLYMFTTHFEIETVKSGYYAFCYIRKNGSNLVRATANTGTVFNPGSATGYVQLNRGDYVDIGGCSEFDNMYHDTNFNFAGSLVTPS